MESVNWKSDGYKLFDISVIAPGNRDGLTKPLPEATALFMSRSLWDEVGGFDERFHLRRWWIGEFGHTIGALVNCGDSEANLYSWRGDFSSGSWRGR